MAKIVALAGGVGGAKLAHGLQQVLPAGDLTVIVNTADDDEFHGLLVCPDHDTVCYTLAGMADREHGWGLAGETWAASSMLARLGEPTWFRLGDRDLAVHVHRTNRLRGGARLTDVDLGIQASLGVPSRILPMADEPVRTQVRTPHGWLTFQDYFVRQHQAPDVLEVRFDGIAAARPTAEIAEALATAAANVVCPSNPYVSIGPILAVPGMRDAIAAARDRGVPVVAVSPIVGGHALKGPADRMLVSLAGSSSAVAVARILSGVIDVFVIDELDASLAVDVTATGIRPVVAATVMTDDAARASLARVVLAAGGVS